jgi:threonine synthase
MDELGAVQKAPDLEAMRHDIFAVSISDEETKSTIKYAYQKYGLILEPHGSVGFAGLMRYLEEVEDWSPCISLETADPAKFPDEIVRLIGVEPEVPVVMSNLSELEESYDQMANDYISLKALLRGLFSSKKPSREEVLTPRSARDISINKKEGVHETTKPTDILR